MAHEQGGVITFDIGGEIFKLFEHAVRAKPDTLLCTLLDDPGRDQDTAAPIFVQANGKLFPYIMEWYIYGKICLPSTVSLEAMRRECAFYQLPDDVPITRERLSAAMGGITQEIAGSIERSTQVLKAARAAYALAASRVHAAHMYRQFLCKLQVPLVDGHNVLALATSDLEGKGASKLLSIASPGSQGFVNRNHAAGWPPQHDQAYGGRASNSSPTTSVVEVLGSSLIGPLAGFQGEDCSILAQFTKLALSDGWSGGDAARRGAKAGKELKGFTSFRSVNAPQHSLARKMVDLGVALEKASQAALNEQQVAVKQFKEAACELVAAHVYLTCLEETRLAAEKGTLGVFVSLTDVDALPSCRLNLLTAAVWGQLPRQETKKGLQALFEPEEKLPPQLEVFTKESFEETICIRIRELAQKDAWTCALQTGGATQQSQMYGQAQATRMLKITWPTS